MSRKHWKERFSEGGVCDFKANYDFFFKWLLSKTCACFYIEGLPETLDEYYIKSSLLLDGDIAITDKFKNALYAVLGAPGGEPDEYYRPTIYTVANPALGSGTITNGVDGVIIYNTPSDVYVPGGIYGLISQTATLLADNIVSINCCQINARVVALVTADGKAQAFEAENTMKNIYAGKPYKILRSDIIERININPIASTQTSSNISELVELHNYIVSNYFQSIGIRSNNLRKKSHMLQDEIDVQNNFLQISIYEILTSWQKGFDKVNELYGTDIKVHINPALLSEFEELAPEQPTEEAAPEQPTEEAEPEQPTEETAPEQPTEETEPEQPAEETEPEQPTEEDKPIAEEIKEQENELTEIVDIINDTERGEELEPDNEG